MYENQLSLRNAGSDELDRVSLLIRDANEQYRRLLPPEAWKFYVNDMMNVRARINESELILAELDGQLVGTVTLYLNVGNASMQWLPKGWAGVRLLAVHPAYRRRGIGLALMEECVSRCRHRSISTIGLHTTEMMEFARLMYEKMRFVRVPEYDFYPRPGVIVMAYRLDLKTLT
ncbi:GNAT family N-acetyltransferase [Chloroflexota bacterium]